MKRTKSLEALNKIGEKVLVSGWVNSIRDHGQLLFIDLRDYQGIIQIVINPENKEIFEEAKKLGNEFVFSVEGTVSERKDDLVNPNIPTGKIEIEADTITILNKSKPLPFPIDDDGRKIDENLRLTYRYLDMRRDRIKDIMLKKSNFLMAVRNYMNENGFLEVQTPLLTSTSPEGARDYLVPSRLNIGEFFVLPQAPQQYKQLLMVGGVDKYFQIAPCARDEDPRKDRHAGIFYQIDMEMSFPTIDEIFEACEGLLNSTYKSVSADKKIKQFPFPRLSHKESMEKYGTDKPDIRFGLELQDITDIVKNKTDFNIFNSADIIKTIVVPGGGNLSRNEILEMEDFAKSIGAKGLAYAKVVGESLETGISKFIEPVSNELIKSIGAKDGDILFFGAGESKEVHRVLAEVRNELGKKLELFDKDELAFVWITDFPFYEYDEKQGKLDFGHNPFSMPKGGLEAFETEDLLSVESYQYDLSLNGFEVLSGSIRNHNPEVLVKAFEVLGYTADEVKKRFGGLYNAFQYGAPPHGGWAIGIDRLFMVLVDEPNIRDTYAFPKNQSGLELMMGAPSVVDPKDLEILGIDLTEKAKKRLKKKYGI